MTELVREVRFFWNAHGQSGNSWSGLRAAWEIAPFFCLRATVAGTVAQPSGYLCDIRTIDQRLRQAIERLLANHEPPQRYDDALIRISQELVEWRTEPISLQALEWIITPYFSLSLNNQDWNMLTITRQYEFSAAHRLHCPAWSDEENRQAFGKCNNLAGHGHNYRLDIVVAQKAEVTPVERVDLNHIDSIVKLNVIDRLDHQHLNSDVAEFAQLNPSVEHIAQVIWNWLVGRLEPARLLRVRVYETAKTWADVTGD